MGIKNWLNKRREKKESQERFMSLSEDELQALHHTEKVAYLKVANKQVTYRGKINAYKDFPIADDDRKNIDMENELVETDDTDYESEEQQEELQPELEEEEINNEVESKHVYQTVRQM